MVRRSRITLWFGAGALAGTVAVLGVYLKWFPVEATPAAPHPALSSAPTEPQPLAAAVQVQQVAATCPSQPLIAPVSSADGRFALEATLASPSRPDASAFLVVAREAAEQGRARDAEVALLAACHASEQASGAQSAPAADVKTQVGQQYAALAARAEGESFRNALMQRASALLNESAQAYAAALGPQSSKTRLARERVAALNDPSARMAKPAPMTVAAPRSQMEEPDTTRMGAARPSLTERPPARSEDLRQVDQDLDRLYAQARTVSRDRAGLQQRHQQAMAQRSACGGDDACLRQWYAERRRQLFNEF